MKKDEITSVSPNSTNAVLPAGWYGIDKIPPDEMVEVIDINGNTAFANPTYFPFEVVKMEGDEKKQWGWRGTPVFYEDGQSKWDGGWMIASEDLSSKVTGNIIGWRNVKSACR